MEHNQAWAEIRVINNLPRLLFAQAQRPSEGFRVSAFPRTAMKDDSAYRLLTPKPGWLQKSCERCNRDFWLAPAQFNSGKIRYCTSTCRYEAPIKVIERTTTKGVAETDCWISSLTPSSPYPLIKTKSETLRVARVVLEAALGRPIAPGMLALHQCDNTRCVRVGPKHIHEGTQKKNMEEAVERGRNVKGITHGNSVFTTEQVIEIRKLKGTMLLREAAQSFNVSISAIHGIWSGRRYKEIGVDAISPQQ